MNSIKSKNQEKDNAAWPISPSFLVKPVILENETFSQNKHGIYASNTVRGLVADASDDPDIQNPLSLFQVVPKSYKPEKFDYIKEITPAKYDSYLKDILEGEKIIRIDPKTLYRNKTCCDKFRECNGYENKCHEQDCRIALLYHKDLKGLHYTDNFEEYYNRLKEIIDKYNQKIAKAYPLHCEQDKENSRLYVWYQCPYSQFLEYFFPIIHAGKVIAVLMQGQRISQESLNQKDLFKEVLADEQVNEDKKTNLRRSIEYIQDDEFGEAPMPESRLKAIWKRIRNLEEHIDREVMAYARAYVSDNFHRIEDQFHQQIKNEINPSGELVKAVYTKIVNGTLQEICDIFNKEGFIRIYSTESEFEEVKSNTDTFCLIGAYPELTETEKQDWEKIRFQDLPSDSKELEAMKNEDFNPYLHPYLNKKITFHEDVIFHIESLSIGNTKHLIWAKYPKDKDIDKKQFDEFYNFLTVFFHTLWESYNLLCNVKLRKQLETSMRVSVHETSQIIPAIINTLEKEYNKLIPNISKTKKILYDTIHRLLLLDNLYRRSTLMFKELEPKTEWRDLYRLIDSAKNMCEETAQKNNMQKIIIKGINEFKINQYKVYTDDQLISHTFFNLIDNAIKYGYMGSNIRINISLSEADLQNERNGNWRLIKAIRISIVSYGTGIREEDKKHIYELFYRSQASKVKDGMGIGLFLVKKICSSLGYTVEYSGKKLSEYNLPMYYHGKKQNKTAQLKLNNVSDSLIEEVVNKDLLDGDWCIEDFEFQAAINQPTYQNEFTVTLNPINNNFIKPI